ncbi:UV-stimulated scaffold protein A isoform X2 [Nycticebus coucang]|uniref:UV-stimulated scaffold protein A isoform X2 n=1 Tax=Nycticebus coucang TaxID=9470 RepID=UPI00234D6420|nr:UV-stimulated scaffold protein A isoform X2 [Nycticebus coucang]
MEQKLSQLVEELTTSGEPQLNPEKVKELKKICKSSEEQLGRTYHLLMAQLSREHAQVRLSAFQAVDELFTRSHYFRALLISNFQEFLELTLGTDHEQPLPPPREVAQRLRQAALRAVEAWNEKFGEAYKKLALGYHFLKHNKKVDFQDVNARTLAERKREEEKQKHLDKIYRERAQQAEREMEEMSAEIESCLTEVESCFQLLVPLDIGPSPEVGFLGVASGVSEEGASCPSCPGQAPHCRSGPPDPRDGERPCCSRDLPASVHFPGFGSGVLSEDKDEDSDQEQFVRNHGLGSHKYTLKVELSTDGLKVQENEDNLAIVHAARDVLKLVQNKFLPAVCSWVQRFTRAGVHGEHLKRAIDLKTDLDLVLKKYQELDIIPEGELRLSTDAPEDEDEDEDEDFVEVPEKEGFETCVPDHLLGLGPEAPLRTPEKDLAAQGLQTRTRMRRDEEASDPTSAAAQLRLFQNLLPPPPPSSERALLGLEEAHNLAAERARAPIVPYGVDLCYWGQELPVAGKIVRPDSQHRFWKPSEAVEEVESAAISEMLCSRHITFAGRFEPVQHRCRAPRPDGRLCERQDRLKCPFHGKIIPRDEEGWPLDPEDRAREQRQQVQGRPGWQDPEFMKDVEAGTGVDLGSSRCRGKGKRKKKYPNLTDLRAQANTARARIGKKVFAKAAVRRVITAMNKVDQKKHEKFANQFNYALT